MNKFYVILILITLLSCYSNFRSSESRNKKDYFYNKTIVSEEKGGENNFNNRLRYHSVYKTGNNYYDGRNKILDGDVDGALGLLEKDINNLEYPGRAILWVFLLKCKKNKKEDARIFLYENFENLSILRNENSVIYCFIKYYLNQITEKYILSKMDIWDDLDNCSAYYYYGMYKKYFEEDYVTGNQYLKKVLNTNLTEYSEYKLAEVEVKGFTSRNPGQYYDFPIHKKSINDVEVSGSSMESNIFRSEENNNKNYIIDDMNHLSSDEDFREINEDEYLIPTIDRSSWEIVDRAELLEILKEEAVNSLEYMMTDDNYIIINDNYEIQYIPDTLNYESFVFSKNDYHEQKDYYKNYYNLSDSEINLYLNSGDFISGVKVQCDMYDSVYKKYGNKVLVVILMYFSIKEDKRVELINQKLNLIKAE